jgi:hypothetical protein
MTYLAGLRRHISDATLERDEACMCCTDIGSEMMWHRIQLRDFAKAGCLLLVTALGLGIGAEARIGILADDEVCTQLKYLHFVGDAIRCIREGELLMASSNRKTRKKGMVMKQIGEKALAPSGESLLGTSLDKQDVTDSKSYQTQVTKISETDNLEWLLAGFAAGMRTGYDSFVRPRAGGSLVSPACEGKIPKAVLFSKAAALSRQRNFLSLRQVDAQRAQTFMSGFIDGWDKSESIALHDSSLELPETHRDYSEPHISAEEERRRQSVITAVQDKAATINVAPEEVTRLCRSIFLPLE